MATVSDVALRRTVRRGTALLLLQLGAISAQVFQLQPGTDGTVAAFVTVPLFAGALLYFVGSVARQLLLSPDVDESGSAPS